MKWVSVNERLPDKAIDRILVFEHDQFFTGYNCFPETMPFAVMGDDGTPIYPSHWAELEPPEIADIITIECEYNEQGLCTAKHTSDEALERHCVFFGDNK